MTFPQIYGAGLPFAEQRAQPVHETGELPVRARFLFLVRPARQRQRVEVAGEGRVRGVVAKEVGHDPVGHAQRAAEERAFGFLHREQSEGGQRSGREESGPARGLVGRYAAQVQGESDGGPAAADVVVEVAVEGLEGAVQVGGEGDEEEGGVEVGQAEGAEPVGRALCRLRCGR